MKHNTQELKAKAYEDMEALCLTDTIDLFTRMTFLKQIIENTNMRMREPSQWEIDENTVIMDFNT